MLNSQTNDGSFSELHDFVFVNLTVSALTNSHLLQHSAQLPETESRGYFDLQPKFIGIDDAVFNIQSGFADTIEVTVNQTGKDLHLHCECRIPKKKLCEHQTRVLYNLMDRKDLRAFFDKKTRIEKIKPVAAEYGLENEPDVDLYFELEYANRTLTVKPRKKELLAVNPASVTLLENQLLPIKSLHLQNAQETAEKSKMIVVIGQHKYYDQFYISLFEAQTTKDGKIKNPLNLVNPLDILWNVDDAEQLKFLSAVARFQNHHREKKPETDLEGLKSIVKNPSQLEFYYHNLAASENISASSLEPVRIVRTYLDLHINVDQKDQFYEVSGKLLLAEKTLDLEKLLLRYDYFVFAQDTLYLIDNPDVLQVISFFKKHHQKIIIFHAKFEEFRTTVLSKLEDKIRLTYSFLKPATEIQREENGFNDAVQKIIYLEDFGNYVLITPVMKYGGVEVSVFSKKQIYSTDNHGYPFTVERDQDEELRFSTSLTRLHADFQDQPERHFFYLHKDIFLNEEWFLDTFEEWKNQNVQVLGFNKLNKNKLNSNKPKITIHVVSGINWFDTTASVQFGKQKVTLKHLHKAVKNKSKYIALDDGTMGILPAEWIEKFASYFDSGEVTGETIRTSKINFASIGEMYEAELLSKEVREQIGFYKSRFADFDSIQDVAVPGELNATLRDYQKEGLNWLNFLDDFGFGGCLADDMGLGKTLQIIAFVLSQRKKQSFNTNLIVVPTSLIFNWRAEVEKFAPSIRVLTIYGSGRVKDVNDFGNYEIILTSYGTLLSDINFLKKYTFNYIFLDESQAIKNPDSQRYKAARLLAARNRIVLTGTPVENNTFDLYGQLSFACPGLLGNKIQFQNHYSTPIDRFHDQDRARDLQRKISPFVLRRTKKQVAKELPDKTEMVLYCEMGEEQRKVYNAYEMEFFNFLNTKSELDIPRESLHVLQGLTKLRQICDSPALLNDDLYYGNASAKIDVLIEQIENKSPQHKILVFSQFVTMLDLIKEQLLARNITFEYLTGQTKDRAARVDNFQNNENVRVFLISLKAGGTGLNLTEADYVYLVDPWWNPAVENQAIDRSYRIGQKKNVIAVRMICPNTIEEKIMTMQESKKDLAEDLVKTDVSILKSLSKKDLLELVNR
ncbi:DEAD/DEAH box helicase [Dyadobacter psychrotolerans]|uniref:ATP-dependent helicase n=1 Tax=Dyadobacter psychrotolerans TaxID=2541721 RepID=A0A4R5DSX8_9BACT|nr:DEAD/DEAH box helicase [Dyadobacter psychrotolerans]TDE15380.1 ATP-dependent helicase [Dyadobacter psychrotolerans]